MMKKTMLLACCVMFFACGGCYDYAEPSQLDIVAGMAIDKGAGGFNIACEIIGTGEQNKKTTITRGQGKTIPEAIDDCASPKMLYFGHMQAVVIAEETARRETQDIVDFFSKNEKMPLSASIVISRECRAEELISQETPREEASSFRLAKIAKNAPQNATTAAVPFYKFARMLNSKNAAFLPAVTKDFTTSIAVFQGDKLAGFLDGGVASAFLIASENKDTGRIRAGQGGDLYDFDIVGASVKSPRIELIVALSGEHAEEEILSAASRERLEAVCAAQFQNDLNELGFLLREKYRIEYIKGHAQFEASVRLRGSGRTY